MIFNIHWQDNITDNHDQYSMGVFKGDYSIEETRRKIKGYYKSLADNTGDKDLVVYIYWVEPVSISHVDYLENCLNLVYNDGRVS